MEIILLLVGFALGYGLSNYLNRKQKAIADKINDAATRAVNKGGQGDSEGGGG